MIRALIFAAALGSGGLAAWITFAQDDAPVRVEQTPDVARIAMSEVLVASAEIGQGRLLEETSMRWQPWPEGAVSAGFITRASQPDAIETLAGSLVRSQFQESEPIRGDKLAPAGSGYMSALLPAGKRAVAVRVSAENTAGGFVLPNDRVDVVHTYTRPSIGTEPPQSVSRAILRNVRVLAVDQSRNSDPANPQEVVVGRTATLELDIQQVELIMAAEASGTLSLALRSAADLNEPKVAVKRREPTVGVYRDGKIEVVKVAPHTAGWQGRARRSSP